MINFTHTVKNDTKPTGRKGEDAACLFLESKGHTIVARNYRAAHKEIDIVSVFADEIHIVEVKSRTAPVLAEPESSVDRTKQRNLAVAAGRLLHSSLAKILPRNAEVFFDVVTVVFDSEGTHIQYYPQAYIPLYV